MSDVTKAERSHFTARRGFVAAAGFGVVSLYLLWAIYGAAPLGFGGHDEAQPGHAEEAGGHSGGHEAAPTAEAQTQIAEFRGLAERFAEAYRQPDGSVRPEREKPAMSVRELARLEHAIDGHRHARPHGDQGAASEPSPPAPPAESADGPIDVYLMAFQFGFVPAVLRLEAGVPYRFRMMAVDVAHGASVRVGPGARVVRLRPGVLVEQELTFQKPGEHLLYCTVYCGVAHDRMQGKIVVTEQGAGS